MMTTKIHAALLKGADAVKSQHLGDLIKEQKREAMLYVSALGITADFTREKLHIEDMQNLLCLARERNLEDNIQQMFKGEKINATEGRPVLHVALRAPASHVIKVDNVDVIPLVHDVLSKIASFSERVRRGDWTGFTGKPLSDVICIGIGGSYLGSEFVYEAMRTNPECCASSTGRRLRFLANVDPVDVARATMDYNPETTLVIVISKTFTTAETMLNARTLKKWLTDSFHDPSCVAKHMVAVSTNIHEASHFGILPENVFGFWDWVGGRFSVTSAVGCLPLALHFGFSHVRRFLDGCHAMDEHFRTAALEHNLPVLMGLISIWNSTYLHYDTVAILPYSQCLLRFAAHIQQLTMESNGKRVTMDGKVLSHDAGEIFFGEPGTNGQHSFYQLLHQGRVVPTEFIGFVQSQNPIELQGEPVSNHDELMSNFFAQPDALAFGKSEAQCRAEGVPNHLISHKVFPGNRPSLSLLFRECTPFTLGLLLALYEHRTAVQGFIWGINSFDQWGVELGKVLAKNVREYLSLRRQKKDASHLESSLTSSTLKLLNEYVAHSSA